MNIILSAEDISEMINLYLNEEYSIRSISRKFNIGEKRLREVFKSNKVIIRKSGKSSKLEISIKDECKIIELYKSGIPIREIAKTYKTSRIRLSEILKNNGLNIIKYPKKYSLDENYFSKIDTANKAYWLGFLYADGNLDKNRDRINIVLQKKDYKHLEKLKKELKCDYPIRFYTQSRWGKQNKVCVLSFTSKQMYEDLIKLGCFPKKTYCLEYPNKNVLGDYELDMIRGFIDGNGTVSIPLNRVAICGRLSFVQEIAKVLYPNRVCKFFPTSENKIAYQFHVSNLKDFIRITNLLYKNAEMYLDRKNPFKDKDVF
jgi:phage antirepressor YoqD-like protein